MHFQQQDNLEGNIIVTISKIMSQKLLMAALICKQDFDISFGHPREKIQNPSHQRNKMFNVRRKSSKPHTLTPAIIDEIKKRINNNLTYECFIFLNLLVYNENIAFKFRLKAQSFVHPVLDCLS